MTLYKIINTNGTPTQVTLPGHLPINLPPQGTFNYNALSQPVLPAGIVAAVMADQPPNSFEALAESIGSPSDPPWNGTDPAASLISIMKKVALK